MGDLQDTDLRGIDLRGVNLLAANLSRANLSGVDLRNANLSGATAQRQSQWNGLVRGEFAVGIFRHEYMVDDELCADWIIMKQIYGVLT